MVPTIVIRTWYCEIVVTTQLTNTWVGHVSYLEGDIVIILGAKCTVVEQPDKTKVIQE